VARGARGVRCGHLVDPEGRVEVLFGINARVEGLFDVTFDDGRTPLEPIPAFSAEDATRMRALGFDSLRLPINWSGLEPKDGEPFSEPYLSRLEEVVSVAGQVGLSVLVDFHQDAYSKEIGEDGAPLWAIVPAPEELLEGPLTDLEERRKSPQVLAAFSTFFGPSEGGAGLRTRYARAVAEVASRLRGRSEVVGIEAFNEPLSPSTYLDALHDEVIARVREVDPERLVFFEPDALRNVLDRATLATRDPWPRTAYAPHVYTLAFTGTDEQRAAITKETLRPSNEAAREEAASWRAPLVITEFGYDPKRPEFSDYIAWQLELQDEVQASAYFWLWKEQSQDSWGVHEFEVATGEWQERPLVLAALARVAPERIPGFPVRYGYDRAARRFELTFDGEPGLEAPALLRVPPALGATSLEATCDGAPAVVTRDEASASVSVPCRGAGRHTLVLTLD
jgi:endoglycosylceramidase